MAYLACILHTITTLLTLWSPICKYWMFAYWHFLCCYGRGYCLTDVGVLGGQAKGLLVQACVVVVQGEDGRRRGFWLGLQMEGIDGVWGQDC